MMKIPRSAQTDPTNSPATNKRGEQLDALTREALDQGHEPDTALAKWIAAVGFGLLVMVTLAGLSAWGLTVWYRGRETQARATGITQTPAQGGPVGRVADWVNPGEDLARLRQREMSRLHGYKVLNKDKRIIRIPIDRAMQLLAQKHEQLGKNFTPLAHTEEMNKSPGEAIGQNENARRSGERDVESPITK